VGGFSEVVNVGSLLMTVKYWQKGLIGALDNHESHDKAIKAKSLLI